MKQSFMLLFQGRLQFEAFNSCRYIQSPYELLGAKRPTDFFCSYVRPTVVPVWSYLCIMAQNV